MKLLYKIMIAAGVLMLLSAAGNDDLYGPAYPLHEMVLTLMSGLAMIVGGFAIRAKKGE